jgi:hypothetical protein
MFLRASPGLALLAVIVSCLAPFVYGRMQSNAEPKKSAYYKGKVVPLAGIVEKFGSRLDPEAAPHWLALSSDGGKLYPLIQDDGSRMFFKDPALSNRPMRLTGRLIPGSELLQVIEVHSVLQGQLHEIYYWCNVCSIKRFEKKICDCCGGPMELREVPVDK